MGTHSTWLNSFPVFPSADLPQIQALAPTQCSKLVPWTPQIMRSALQEGVGLGAEPEEEGAGPEEGGGGGRRGRFPDWL